MLLGLLRWTYLSVLVLSVGAVVFAWRVAPRMPDPAAARRHAAGVASAAGWMLVAAAILRLADLQWQLFESFRAADARTLLLETSWGRAIGVQAVAGLALGAGARRLSIAGPAALALAAAAAFAGHPAAAGPLTVVLDALHVLGASAWIGGLATLCWTVLRRRATAALGPTLAAFSPVALAGASLAGLTGVVQAQRLMGGFGALTTTRYGVTLMVKVALLGVVAALGARNWQLLTPRVDDPGGAARLRAGAWAELAVAAAALAVTSALVVTPPRPE